MMEIVQLILGCVCAFMAGRAVANEQYGFAGLNAFLAFFNGMGALV